MDSRKQTYDAIRSAIAVLDDPFTRFLEPGQYSALKRQSSGAVTGVGLEVGFGTSNGTSGDLVVAPRSPFGLQSPLVTVLRHLVLPEENNEGGSLGIRSESVFSPCTP